MVRLIERIPKKLCDEIGLFDAVLMFYQGLIALDHVQHRLWIVENVFTEGKESLQQKYDAAVKEIAQTRKLLEQPVAAEERKRNSGAKETAPLEIESNFKKPAYLAAVKKAKEYIRAGDIFQVVISQRFSAKTEAEPFQIYRELRALNPSPYLFFLQLNDVAVGGSSPEMMVKIEGRGVSFPAVLGTQGGGEKKAGEMSPGNGKSSARTEKAR